MEEVINGSMSSKRGEKSILGKKSSMCKGPGVSRSGCPGDKCGWSR